MKHAALYIFCLFLFVTSGNLYGQTPNLSIYKPYFNRQLKGWTQTFDKFTLSAFKKDESATFENIDYMEAEDVKEFYSVYKPALTFSPDRTQFIDIYSYWLNLEKEGRTIVSHGGEPDQAVTLCNFKTHKWTRILFRGTTERIQEVLWTTNSKFILLGIRESSPIMYLGDTNNRTFTIFIAKNIKSAKKGGFYDSPKLLKLKIKQL